MLLKCGSTFRFSFLPQLNKNYTQDPNLRKFISINHLASSREARAMFIGKDFDTNMQSSIDSILTSLPHDLSIIFSENKSLDESHSSPNMLKNIHSYLSSRLKTLYVGDSVQIPIEKNLELFQTLLLSSQKSPAFVDLSPIYDEFGFFSARHYLFNLSYLIRSANELRRIKSSNMKNCLSDFLKSGYVEIENAFDNDVLNEVRYIF